VLGTLLNVIGILAGGLAGRFTHRNLSAATQHQARLFLTGLTLVVGMATVWSGLSAPLGTALRQFALATLALAIGSLTGHLLGLQRGLGRLVTWSRTSSDSSTPATDAPPDFALVAVVLAANPLGVIGALLEGWTGDWRPLALKAVIDGLAALGFAVAGSRSVPLAALPVGALQGTLTLAAVLLARSFPDPALGASLRVTAGLMMVAAAPVVLGVRRIPLANYLCLTAVWH
jgi:uncharacterized membrane protein YqgA involved in biofilm formation